MNTTTTTLNHSFYLRNDGATAATATLSGLALTDTLTAAIIALMDGNRVTLNLLPHGTDTGQSWAEYTDRQQDDRWSTIADSNVYGGVSAVAANGRARGMYVVLSPDSVDFLAGLVDLPAITLTVVGGTLTATTATTPVVLPAAAAAPVATCDTCWLALPVNGTCC